MQVDSGSRMAHKLTSAILHTIVVVLLTINNLQIECKPALIKTESEKDFAPRISHQAPSAELNASEAHSIECPIEARPEGEVIWFHNGERLVQHMANGREFLFLSLDERDTGDYQCQMTNYLGSVTSERIRLTVKSSTHDPRIRFEPRVAEAGPDQQVEFTCSIPLAARRSPSSVEPQSRNGQATQDPEVMWRRDGKRLKVEWLDDGDELPSPTDGPDSAYWSSRFFARRLASGEFVLVITRTQSDDNNATFTCLYRPPESSAESSSSNSKDSQSELPKESSPVRLRVHPTTKQPNNGSGDQIKLVDANLGPPITEQELTDKRPHELTPGGATQSKHNYTTQLIEPSAGGAAHSPRRVNSLKQTLEDLYEIARPALIILGLMVLVIGLVLLQLLYIRRRTRQNRYMKHQYGGSGTNSSGASSAGVGGLAGGSSVLGGLDCDPVLNSLMARTLSAPSAASLGVAGRKFRSYRDHLRKVAAANTDHHRPLGSDLLDGTGQHYFQQQAEQDPFFVGPSTVSQQAANLYNQSLAAREQAARCLLQAAAGADHMRSLSNLATSMQQGKQTHQQQQQHNGGGLRLSQNGSHLNLPLSFAFGGSRTNANQDEAQLMASALWSAHLAAQSRQQQQNKQQSNQTTNRFSKQDENYQLVTCASSSISPSSTSSMVEGNSPPNHQDKAHPDTNQLNHYSTIENDEDDRYEEVDLQPGNRTSTKTFKQQQQHRSSLRASLISDSSTSGCGDLSSTNTGSSSLVSNAFDRFGSKRSSNGGKQSNLVDSSAGKRKFNDQLSPYAVSSICGNMTQQQQQQSLPPPPMSTEAMRALNEQFDLNQLMLLDSGDQVTSDRPPLPFNAPPPPSQIDRDDDACGSELCEKGPRRKHINQEQN